ncbi:MAG TPA: ABC transporter ATP-binding protein [Candidatus Saccharimonadales bacterium]|nr:ABC transporter ATP-binding protein [Candidatus Saccharimonadales bacterium]
MMQVKHLTRTFTAGDTTVTAVSDVSFEVPDGRFASIIGKSGSGKSTLLSLLGALDKPTSGSIEIDGGDIATLSDRALVTYRRKKIGFVFQNYNLIPNLTALENVMLPMSFNGLSAAARKARAVALLEQVGITADKQQRKPGRLSGGEQQRVAIARALANQPAVILADEPTGNLDTETGKMIFDLLHNLARTQKTTIIVVTHDLSIAGRTDESFRLQDGRLAGRRARA